MRHCLRLFALTMCFVSLMAPAWGAEAPREKIARLNATLLEVMRNADTLGFQGRHAKLRPVMAELYDFAFMARIAVGGYWKTLEKRDRERLIDAFERISIATYAARFDGYSGERFEIVYVVPEHPVSCSRIHHEPVRSSEDPFLDVEQYRTSFCNIIFAGLGFD